MNYRGEISVILYNTSEFDFNVNVGDRIAQLVLCPIQLWNSDVVREKCTLDIFLQEHDSDRGEKGFGSSGIK